MSKLMEVRKAREPFYGPFRENHEAIGSILDGILLQMRWDFHTKPLKDHPEIVCLMMSALKHAREAFRHKDDNIVDAKNYLDMTGELYGEPVVFAGSITEEEFESIVEELRK